MASRMVSFRANDELVAAITEGAQRSDLNASEFMRRLVAARARAGIETSRRRERVDA